MNLKHINPGAIAILCAASLGAGIVARAITTTPPSKSTPTTTSTPAPKNPSQSIPVPTPASAPKTPVQSTPTPASKTPATKLAPANTTPASTPTTNPQPAAAKNIIPLVAVPDLTPATIKNFTNLYGQIIEVKFTPNQQQRIARRVKQDWMLNLGLRNTVNQTIALESQIANGAPAERTQLQSKLIGNLRQQAVDGDLDALWLVSFYDAEPKNWLAKGKTPLTRMSTDISADALCFMVNEIMGKSVVSPDSKLKNAIATKLTTEYPKLSPDIKQQLSRLPANWLKFRDGEWFSRGDVFREQMRVHWAKNLEVAIPEIKEMSKLRRDRLTKLQSDPTLKWNTLNSIQKQSVLQKSDLDFQTSVRALPPVKTVQLTNYINSMQVGNAIGNSPTRYSLKLNVK
jgi:hypothetical protein